MKISIITINYNNRDGLRNTLESVAAQSDRRFEYIVVDGGSTDGSVEEIRRHEPIISRWISEPDKGIYDAMNKGVAMATGEYVVFVNSGDCLHDADVVRTLNGIPMESDICMGRVLNLNDKGKEYLWCPPAEDKLSLQFLRWHPLHHPGAVIRADLQRKYPYDPKLKICSDRRFFIQALIIENASYSPIDITINKMEPQGASGADAVKKMESEDDLILSQLFTARQRRDIESTRYILQEVTRPLTRYYGKSRLLIGLNKCMFKVLNIK